MGSRLARLMALLCCIAIVLPGAAMSQQGTSGRTIAGRVTDSATSAPVAAAQIMLGATVVGTSREDGTFSVPAPAGAVTLAVRRIGYRRVDVSVSPDQQTVNVAMERDPMRLSETIVTGDATGIERRNLATSIASVNAEDLNRVPAASIENMLTGKVAGASIQSNSGAPGGGNQIRLRGISTIIGGATPMYVVDGVIVSDATIAPGVFAITGSSLADRGAQDNASNRIADLDPNTIERVEVLKGAAAAAIYGSRANNGVIVITTKRGVAGRPKVELTQRFGTSRLSNKVGSRRFNSREDAVAAFGPTVGALWQPGVYYDHEQETYGEKPLSWESIVSVNGGTEATRYFISGLLKDDGGIIANTGYRKQSLSISIDQTFGNRLTARVTGNALSTTTGRGLTNNDNRGVALGQGLARSPSFVDLRRQPDGTFPRNPVGASNPLQTAALTTVEEVVYRYIGSANVSYQLLNTSTNQVRLVASGGLDFFNQRGNILAPPELQFEPADGLPGTSVRSNAQSLNVNLNLSGVHTYTSPSDRLQATTSLGYQAEQRSLDNTRVIAQNLIAGLDNIGRATVVGTNEDVSLTRIQGFYVQEELLLDDRKLFLSAGVRGDRSSNNAYVNEFYYFPRASASYRFTSLPWHVDEFKVRAAVGRSGNEPVFGQSYTEFLAASITGLPAIEIGPGAQVAAADLRPEIQTEVETGFDISAFSGRGGLELSVYQKTITDLLVRATLASSTGFGLRIFNGGSARTRGIEVALRGTPILNSRFEWDATTTFSADRSEMLDLAVPPFQPAGFGTTFGTFQVEEGKSLTQIVGNDTLPDGRAIVTQVGDANPSFRMGFNNSFRMWGVNLSTLVDWQQGGQVINLSRYLWDAARNGADCNEAAAAPNATGETVCARRQRTFTRHTLNYLEDATFVKVREVSLSWPVPQSLVERLGVNAESAQLTLAGRDLLTFTGYTGLDPEVSNFGTQSISRGFDVSPYPPSRSFWLSIGVVF